MTAAERESFIQAARSRRAHERTLAETLAFTGCRISEALALVPERIELDGERVVFRSLKKRRSDVYRAVPVPSGYLDTLDVAHGVREAQKSVRSAYRPLWSWSRQHAYELMTGLMVEAGIPEGPHRAPKGLRHAYGVAAIGKGIPLNMLQKWMGHAQLSTTAIYANAVGAEESAIASRMWS
jgi:integrase